MRLNILTALVLAITFFLSYANDVTAEEYRYNTEVTLEGALVEHTSDPEATSCSIAHKYLAINVHDPISVICDPLDTFCKQETGIILMQLVLTPSQMTKFNRLKGKTVKLRGTLVHAESGHDFTSVLMHVEAMSP